MFEVLAVFIFLILPLLMILVVPLYFQVLRLRQTLDETSARLKNQLLGVQNNLNEQRKMLGKALSSDAAQQTHAASAAATVKPSFETSSPPIEVTTTLDASAANKSPELINPVDVLLTGNITPVVPAAASDRVPPVSAVPSVPVPTELKNFAGHSAKPGYSDYAPPQEIPRVPNRFETAARELQRGQASLFDSPSGKRTLGHF